MELALENPSVLDSQLISAMTEEIKALLPAVVGGGYALANSAPIRLTRRYSFQFRFSAVRPGASPQNLLVKIHRKPAMTTLQEAIRIRSLRSDAQREFEILRLLENAVEQANHPRLCAIRALKYLPDFNAIVMRELELRPFKDFYFELPFITGDSAYWTDLEAKLTLAGKLLKAIHTAFGGPQTATLSELEGWDLAEREFSRLERLISVPRLLPLKKRFWTAYNEIKDARLPVASLHKDFHLGNIFVSTDGKVGALDPNWQERGAAYEDVARLLVDPMTRQLQIITQGLYFRRPLRRRFEEAVLRGYDDGYNYLALHYYCALLSLTIWRTNEQRLASWRSTLLGMFHFLPAAFMRFYFEKLVLSYLSRGFGFLTNSSSVS